MLFGIEGKDMNFCAVDSSGLNNYGQRAIETLCDILEEVDVKLYVFHCLDKHRGWT